MAWIYELNNSLIEYAAEMGLEHNLGLTCDPVGGYVQIPCIERNGFGALRAIDAASYAKQLGYLRKNKVSFDSIVNVMKETGKDLNSAYKETSLGGLAKEFGLKDECIYMFTFLFVNLSVVIVIFARSIMIKNGPGSIWRPLSFEINEKSSQTDHDTIYIGGGTPTALTDEQLKTLFQ